MRLKNASLKFVPFFRFLINWVCAWICDISTKNNCQSFQVIHINENSRKMSPKNFFLLSLFFFLNKIRFEFCEWLHFHCPRYGFYVLLFLEWNGSIIVCWAYFPFVHSLLEWNSKRAENRFLRFTNLVHAANAVFKYVGELKRIPKTNRWGHVLN